MRKRWIMWVFIGLVGLTASVAIVSLCSKAKEPSYGGHRLSYWFHELPLTLRPFLPLTLTQQSLVSRVGLAELTVDRWGRTYGVQREEASRSVAAIQAMSTNGLSFLICKLGARRWPVIERLGNWAFSHGIKLAYFADLEMERAQALTALLALPPLPAGAVDQLQKLRRSKSGQILFSVNLVLEAQTNSDLRLVRDWLISQGYEQRRDVKPRNDLRPLGDWRGGSNAVDSPRSENVGASGR